MCMIQLQNYNELLEIYFDEYCYFSGFIRKKIDSKCDLANLILDTYDYTEWFKKVEESLVIPLMPPLKGDEERKEGKGLKI